MSKQYILNVDYKTLTLVDWPNYPQLFSISSGCVVQIHIWAALLNKWVIIVPFKTFRSDVAEVFPAELKAISNALHVGADRQTAIRKVLGL